MSSTATGESNNMSVVHLNAMQFTVLGIQTTVGWCVYTVNMTAEGQGGCMPYHKSMVFSAHG